MCQTHSEQVDKIAEALATAQGKMGAAGKNAQAPVTKNGNVIRKYADLASVFDVLRQTLPMHGLAVTQALLPREDDKVHVRTTLLHTSGQWISSECIMPCDRQGGIQGMGSAITYARRYSLSALVGVVSEGDDDDGNEAQNNKNNSGYNPSPPYQEQSRKPPDRLNLEGIEYDLSCITTEKDFLAYWNAHRIGEDHPDAARLLALFGKRKKEIMAQAASADSTSQASPPPQAVPHISLDDARFEFMASNTPEDLKATAVRLRIMQDNPDYQAITEAYTQRLDELGGGKSKPANAQGAKLTDEQRKAIQASYSGWQRDERLTDISQRLGREVSSVNDLSRGEASDLLSSFKESAA